MPYSYLFLWLRHWRQHANTSKCHDFFLNMCVTASSKFIASIGFANWSTFSQSSLYRLFSACRFTLNFAWLHMCLSEKKMKIYTQNVGYDRKCNTFHFCWLKIVAKRNFRHDRFIFSWPCHWHAIRTCA